MVRKPLAFGAGDSFVFYTLLLSRVSILLAKKFCRWWLLALPPPAVFVFLFSLLSVLVAFGDPSD